MLIFFIINHIKQNEIYFNFGCKIEKYPLFSITLCYILQTLEEEIVRERVQKIYINNRHHCVKWLM